MKAIDAPNYAVEAMREVRANGRCNISDAVCVTEHMKELNHSDAVEWLRTQDGTIDIDKYQVLLRITEH